MNSPAKSKLAAATNAKGFPGFFRKPADWEAVAEVRPYRQHLQRAWDEFGLCAVLCVEGKPTIYFKSVARADLQQEAEWHKMLWNQGTVAMLVVQDSTKTRIYSALARPGPKPARDNTDARLASSSHFETWRGDALSEVGGRKPIPKDATGLFAFCNTIVTVLLGTVPA
ncbi:MAG: hypothetical protein IH623_02380, partial [Verrucomicrobia bacterium]|nr:hypothetical protein [Verrucomicrobiota bacterium]